MRRVRLPALALPRSGSTGIISGPKDHPTTEASVDRAECFVNDAVSIGGKIDSKVDGRGCPGAGSHLHRGGFRAVPQPPGDRSVAVMQLPWGWPAFYWWPFSFVSPTKIKFEITTAIEKSP